MRPWTRSLDVGLYAGARSTGSYLVLTYLVNNTLPEPLRELYHVLGRLYSAQRSICNIRRLERRRVSDLYRYFYLYGNGSVTSNKYYVVILNPSLESLRRYLPSHMFQWCPLSLDQVLDRVARLNYKVLMTTDPLSGGPLPRQVESDDQEASRRLINESVYSTGPLTANDYVAGP